MRNLSMPAGTFQRQPRRYIVLAIGIIRLTQIESDTDFFSLIETSAAGPVTTPEMSTATLTTPLESSETQTGVLVPVITSTTDAAGGVVQQTTTALAADAPTTVVVPITTTNNDGQTITSSTSAPAVIVSSTDSVGSVVTSAQLLSTVAVAPGGSVVTSAETRLTTTAADIGTVVLTSPRAGGVYTVTNNLGRTVTVTYTPPTGLTVSQQTKFKTTLSDGTVSTVTSVVVVGAVGTQTSRLGTPATSKQPSLMTGAAAVLGSDVLSVAPAMVAAVAMGLVGFMV
jgi:hypothetical protein